MRATEVFDELEVVVESDGRPLTEYDTRFSPATPTFPPTFECYLEADPDEAAHIVIRRHQAKRWTGDLMTDPVVDRKLLSTAYFRGHERREGVRHAAFPSLLRYSRTPDELIILNNGHSERLGTIEVSVWRGIFRSHKKDTTTNTKTATQSTWFNGSADLSSASESGPKITEQKQLETFDTFDTFNTFEDDHLYPWCRFIFRYGTRDTLVANGIDIIPRTIDQDLEAALRALENPDLLIESRGASPPTQPPLEVQSSQLDPSPSLSTETLRLPLASETHQPIHAQGQPTAKGTDSNDSTDSTDSTEPADPPDGENVDALQTALNALFSETVLAHQSSLPQPDVDATSAVPGSSAKPSQVSASSPIDTSLLSNPILAPSRSINHIIPSKRSPTLSPCTDQLQKPSADPKRSRGQAQKTGTRATLRTNLLYRATIPPERGTASSRVQGQSARLQDASTVSMSRRSQSDTERRRAEIDDSPRTRKLARSKSNVTSRPPSWRDWKPTRYPAASHKNTSPSDPVRGQSSRAADRQRAGFQVLPTPAPRRASRYIDLTIDDSDEEEEYAARREIWKRATGRTAAEAIDLT